jgi:hypothetical protein
MTDSKAERTTRRAAYIAKAGGVSFQLRTIGIFAWLPSARGGHERLSTKAIVDTLVGHRTDEQADLWDLFGDPQHSITEQVLKACEYPDRWVNRMVLGDSLVVMNSLLPYEGLGGQVQMITRLLNRCMVRRPDHPRRGRVVRPRRRARFPRREAGAAGPYPLRAADAAARLTERRHAHG